MVEPCLRLLLDTFTFNFKTSNQNGDVKNKYCLMVYHCYFFVCMAFIKMNVSSTIQIMALMLTEYANSIIILMIYTI